MKKLAFIGLGNMGRAICSGLIAGGAIPSHVEYAHVMSRSPFWSARYMVSSFPNRR